MSTGGDAVAGKIIALNGDVLTFLPAPYWGVESRTLRLDDIARIQVKRPGRGARAFVYTFATVFSVLGFTAGQSAQYNVDYESALMGSAVVGVAAGLIGALVGSWTGTSNYRVDRLSRPEQRALIWSLMWRGETLPREEGS